MFFPCSHFEGFQINQMKSYRLPRTSPTSSQKFALGIGASLNTDVAVQEYYKKEMLWKFGKFPGTHLW